VSEDTGLGTLADEILALVRQHAPMMNADIRKARNGGRPSRYVLEIDRALQKLRKAGLVVPTAKGWMPADVKKCPKCSGTGWVKS
jgi:hypothetical protein